MCREWSKPLSAAAGLLIVVLAGSAMAQDTKPAPETNWIEQLKHPVDWLSWGADVRLRHEFLNNATTLNQGTPGHDWNYERYRVRVWTTVTPVQNLDVNARLCWEGRHWWAPDSKPEWDWFDVPVDQLNVVLKNPFNAPATVTVGRQDFLTSSTAFPHEGWLVGDGTPLDGSRTFFFDAARLNVKFDKCKSTVDMIYMRVYSASDHFLHPIDDKARPMIEQDEEDAIVYLNTHYWEKTDASLYFMYKHADPVLPNGDKGDVYTVGARGAREFSANWKARLEGAYQFGNKENPVVYPTATDGKMSAFGVNGRLTYSFKDKFDDQVWLHYEYLSGDRQGSKKLEAFDPLWGRWPQWSELMIYTWMVETRPSEITNMHRVAIGYDVTPMKDLTFTLDYAALFADQNTYAGRTGFSNGGDFRGHFLQAILKYQFTKNLSGHLWGEMFVPGAYYDHDHRGTATFARAQLWYTL